MSYLLFNGRIIHSDGVHVIPVTVNDLSLNKEARICITEADVLVTSCVEQPMAKRDSILVRKFNESYPDGPYVIQEEKIDKNLFQVIGIKEEKLKEIYAMIPFNQVQTLLPYGAAVRQALIERGINVDEPFVFVEDLGDERLLTAFEGLKFSRTRVIAKTDDDILPEIRRTQIDFAKKIEGYSNKKSSTFIVLVNREALAQEILEKGLKVNCVDIFCPALEGLNKVNALVRYELPEEILKRKKRTDRKNNLKISSIAIACAAVSLVFFLISRVEWGGVHNEFQEAEMSRQYLEDELQHLEGQTYRASLRQQKTFNYALPYLSIINTIPSSYVVSSVKLIKKERWILEMKLFTAADGLIEEIPRIKFLKTAVMRDVLVNNQPGKYIRIIL